MDNNMNNQNGNNNDQDFEKNPGYDQNLYTAPVVNQSPNYNPNYNQGSAGMSIAGMVLGILSICCCCISYVFAIPAFIFSIIALAKKKSGKGMAIAGLITSIIGLIFSVIILITNIASRPYKEGMEDFMNNVEEYRIEYELTGEYPPVINDMIERGFIKEENAAQLTETYLDMFEYINKMYGK